MGESMLMGGVQPCCKIALLIHDFFTFNFNKRLKKVV